MDTIPDGTLEKELKKYLTLDKEKNVYFHALKITDWTNKMFDVMKNTLGKSFFTTDKVIPSDFFQTMFDTMASSIEDSHI